MKVILPIAGKGTRLLPITRHVPKAIVKVAGRPVMDYVMDKLEGLDIEELIIITGHLKEHVEEYVTANYDRPARFVGSPFVNFAEGPEVHSRLHGPQGKLAP
jgi:glucose-1-phosphate thymidylyltransferase